MFKCYRRIVGCSSSRCDCGTVRHRRGKRPDDRSGHVLPHRCDRVGSNGHGRKRAGRGAARLHAVWRGVAGVVFSGAPVVRRQGTRSGDGARLFRRPVLRSGSGRLFTGSIDIGCDADRESTTMESIRVRDEQPTHIRRSDGLDVIVFNLCRWSAGSRSPGHHGNRSEYG